jgi:hypothetical protein
LGISGIILAAALLLKWNYFDPRREAAKKALQPA